MLSIDLDIDRNAVVVPVECWGVSAKQATENVSRNVKLELSNGGLRAKCIVLVKLLRALPPVLRLEGHGVGLRRGVEPRCVDNDSLASCD